MTRPREEQPAIVPLAQQAGEILSRWRWVEPSAWTVRMLATLEQGVEGGKWFRLFDKVFSERNLLAAFQQVASNDGAAGVDHVSVAQFERGLPETLWEIADQLKHGAYQPQAIQRVHIPKFGTKETRPLGIPMCRSYCTSFQRGWGLREEGLALPWALSRSGGRMASPGATRGLA
jgi:RNA-directed DNA polymerase